MACSDALVRPSPPVERRPTAKLYPFLGARFLLTRVSAPVYGVPLTVRAPAAKLWISSWPARTAQRYWRRAAGSLAATCRATASGPGRAERSRLLTEACRERAGRVGGLVALSGSRVSRPCRHRGGVRP